MLKANELSNRFWGEAVLMAVYILNRMPARSVEGVTPFEVWYGKKPLVHHLCTFRYLSMSRTPNPICPSLRIKATE
jgi:hypothetical protein